ncbi:MAG: DNA polymerase III subunit gamma/tau [Clostridia bacterium]
MAYRALYRQYRPTRFCEVIGQEPITTTLKNQVASGHLAHAYLFCGTRGTGKTTSARILARAVNCLCQEEGEPCGQCTACLAAANENNGDIIEIDAASNNGVDDVRALIEKSQFSPMQLSRRVFIIDEVHMLSGSAFNALLKTLEEPPDHVLFILATTEPQKLPATILSRCQRFDFHRLSVQNIIATLKSVLLKAGANISEEGLLLIARAADGGMRDALSLTDQCLSFCGDSVSTQDVYDVLGSMEEGFLFDIADALLMSDAPKALIMLDGIVRGGRDLSVFCADLSAHFRALLLANTCGICTELLDCTKETMQRYLEQAKTTSQARLLLAMEQLLHAQGDMRYLSSPRYLLESTLVRICRPEDELSLAALEARVDRLEGGFVSPSTVPTALDVSAATFAETSTVVSRTTPGGYDDIPLPPPPPEDNAQFVAPMPNPEIEPTQTRVPEPKPIPAAAKAVSAESDDPDALWGSVLSAMQSENLMVYMLAKSATAQSFTDNTLAVGLPETDEALYKNLSAAINFNQLQNVLTKLRPDAKLMLIKLRVQPATDEATAKAKVLFGDQLVIE